MAGPVEVGLVGTGSWAAAVVAPVLAEGARTRLVGVWGRNAAAATDIASAHGAVRYPTFEDLLGACEAVAFCVPPAVQVELATAAAAAGRPVLLNKPLAEDVAGAERVARAVDRARVPAVLALGWHCHPVAKRFAARCERISVVGCHARFLSSALVAGPFRTEWRLRRGAVLDIGPHLFDLLEVCAGPIESVGAIGDPLGAVSLTTCHASGAVGAILLSTSVRTARYEAGLAAYGTEGCATLDCSRLDARTSLSHVSRMFAGAVRDATPVDGLDAWRGVRLQRLVDATERSLLAGAPVALGAAWPDPPAGERSPT